MRGNILQVLCVVCLVASVSLFNTGCAKKPVDSAGNGEAVSVPTTVTPSSTPTRDTGDTAGIYEPIDSGESSVSSEIKISEGRTHEGLLPIYFDFDKSNVRDDQKERLVGNAAFIKANRNMKITIEGNCDERGTNEYNIALGERRAQAAKKYLINLGVSPDVLYTVSYGEERPLLFGHDEYSWSQNRRDDFVIQ